jgi:hypothetical protein
MAKVKKKYFLARWIIFTIGCNEEMMMPGAKGCNGEMMMPGAKGRQWGDDDAWGMVVYRHVTPLGSCMKSIIFFRSGQVKSVY